MGHVDLKCEGKLFGQILTLYYLCVLIMWAECQGSAVVMSLVVSVPKYKISEYPFMIISFGPLERDINK